MEVFLLPRYFWRYCNTDQVSWKIKKKNIDVIKCVVSFSQFVLIMLVATYNSFRTIALFPN